MREKIVEERGLHARKSGLPTFPSLANSVDLHSPLFSKLKDLEEGEIGKYFLWENGENVKFELKYQKVGFDKNCRYIIVVRDISILQALNKAITEEKYKRLMISTISHEFRTPISSILTGVSLALDEVSPEGAEYLECVKASAESLQFFIEDVVDFTKISDGTFLLKYSSFQIRNTTLQLLRILQRKIQEKQLEVSFIIPPSIPQ